MIRQTKSNTPSTFGENSLHNKSSGPGRWEHSLFHRQSVSFLLLESLQAPGITLFNPNATLSIRFMKPKQKVRTEIRKHSHREYGERSSRFAPNKLFYSIHVHRDHLPSDWKTDLKTKRIEWSGNPNLELSQVLVKTYSTAREKQRSEAGRCEHSRSHRWPGIASSVTNDFVGVIAGLPGEFRKRNLTGWVCRRKQSTCSQFLFSLMSKTVIHDIKLSYGTIFTMNLLQCQWSTSSCVLDSDSPNQIQHSTKF